MFRDALLLRVHYTSNIGIQRLVKQLFALFPTLGLEAVRPVYLFSDYSRSRLA